MGSRLNGAGRSVDYTGAACGKIGDQHRDDFQVLNGASKVPRTAEFCGDSQISLAFQQMNFCRTNWILDFIAEANALSKKLEELSRADRKRILETMNFLIVQAGGKSE